MRSTVAGGAVAAAAMAAPMKGAVQGVATTTASRPVKKLPISPPRRVSPSPTPTQPPPISKTPDKFNPIANRSQATAATKTGDWN